MSVIFSDDQKAFINSQRVLRFNSLTPSGEIHSVPICYAFDGNNFYVHARNKSGKKRWRDLEKNNKISLELDHYIDDWSSNKGLLVYARASFLEPGPEQRKGVSLLKERYSQYRNVLDDSTSIVKCEPVKVVSWAPVYPPTHH